MKNQDLSNRLYDITHYLRIPQWVVCDQYVSAKHDFKMHVSFMPNWWYVNKALTNLYNRYEAQLLKGLLGLVEEQVLPSGRVKPTLSETVSSTPKKTEKELKT